MSGVRGADTWALRDLADKLKHLDDEDLEIEDLPDDFGHDWRR